MQKFLTTVGVLSLSALLGAGSAFAAGAGHGHGAHHGDGMGQVGAKGDPVDARRTLSIAMTDNAYAPKSITVQKGETVRFIVKNSGEFVHEFNIGTAEMHKAHQGEMLAMMESGALGPSRIDHSKMGAMQHDDPNSILLEPGQSGEIVWTFGISGEIEFACNVPGHYESGMVGKVKVR